MLTFAYDRFWTDEWHERGLSAPGYVPIAQSLRAFREARVMPQYNMPMSREFMNYCDNRRTCRFEYACPKPVMQVLSRGNVGQQPRRFS
jgi:hypothetical protein